MRKHRSYGPTVILKVYLHSHYIVLTQRLVLHLEGSETEVNKIISDRS
jgi:hypothetical protein